MLSLTDRRGNLPHNDHPDNNQRDRGDDNQRQIQRCTDCEHKAYHNHNRGQNCGSQDDVHKHHNLECIIIGSCNQRSHTDFIHLAVGKGLHLPEYVLSDVMCNSGGNPGAAIAKKNRSADTNKRDDGRQRSHLHQKSSVLVHHTLIDHIGNDRRNPQLDQCKSKDRNHV